MIKAAGTGNCAVPPVRDCSEKTFVESIFWAHGSCCFPESILVSMCGPRKDPEEVSKRPANLLIHGGSASESCRTLISDNTIIRTPRGVVNIAIAFIILLYANIRAQKSCHFLESAILWKKYLRSILMLTDL